MDMTKTVNVDGTNYLIAHPNPTKAWEIGMQLLKIIGEPFAAMAQGAEDEAKALEVLPMAVKALTTNLHPTDSLLLIKQVLASVEIQDSQGKRLIDDREFNTHFQGKLGKAIKLFIECVKFQYKDFSAAIGDAINAAFKKAGDPSASPSQSISVGQ